MKHLIKREIPIEDFQNKINYFFKNINILKEVLTHSSFANESKNKGMKHNERLEFLGDSVLGLIISDYIFLKYSDLPEGQMTKVRANIVCEPSLAEQARRIELGKYLLLGKGEENTGGRERESILADAFEALIGGLYIDGGMKVAKKFVLNVFSDNIIRAEKGSLFKDYKTYLQELLQSRFTEKISYQVINEYGPDHNKTFEVEVFLGGRILGFGKGKSKKEAEQQAAQEALNKEGVEYE